MCKMLEGNGDEGRLLGHLRLVFCSQEAITHGVIMLGDHITYKTKD